MTGSFTFESIAKSHVGLVRKLNEDAFVDRPMIGLWAVADGMGGHQAGDVASRLISEALDAVTPAMSGFLFLTEVKESLSRVNRTLIAQSSQMAEGSLIGSTVVALLAFDGHFACVWAGDSRAYLFRDGQLRRLSRDHSVVQELTDSGYMTVEDARHSKRANVITRAVGVHKDLVLDVVQGPSDPGDRYLLCSDGLTGLVEDTEIAQILSQSPLDAAAEDLIALTLERGAKDNVTVVIIEAHSGKDDTRQTQRP